MVVGLLLQLLCHCEMLLLVGTELHSIFFAEVEERGGGASQYLNTILLTAV